MRDEQLFQALCAQFTQMLDDDFEGLVNAMYRLDVPEQRFKEALAAPTQAERASRLAEAVLEREALRAEMRRRYQK